MFIHLLRHGIAEDPRPGVDDADRALTDEGWKRLRRSAPAWHSLVETPDVVLVSPLRRARETAAAFVEAVHFRGELRIEKALLPGAAASEACALLEAESLSGQQGVALVGHEPHLGYLLGLLLTGNPRLPIPMKKGMLVAVETQSIASLAAELRFALSHRVAAKFDG